MLHRPDGQRRRAPNGIHPVPIQRVKEVRIGLYFVSGFVSLFTIHVIGDKEKFHCLCLASPFRSFTFKEAQKESLRKISVTVCADEMLACGTTRTRTTHNSPHLHVTTGNRLPAERCAGCEVCNPACLKVL